MQTSHSAQKTIYLLFIILFQLQLNAKSIFYESRFDESQICFEEKKEYSFPTESSGTISLNSMMACAITSVSYGTQCNDNGTSGVNDDFYTISINPIGDMLGTTYDVAGNYGITNFSETGLSYGMSTMLSVNVPIGIPTDITVTDGTDSNCTYTFRVGSPAECSSPFECWAIADQGEPDQLYHYNSSTGVWTKAPNSTGVNGIESVAYDPNNSILYSANQDHVGTVNVSTGVFTPITGSTAIDTIYGPNGPHNIADIDGMSYDLYTDILWASERRGGATQEDYIFQIDPLTGQPIPNAFGPGMDYIVSPAVYDSVIMQLVYDVDDIAIDPVTGNLYLVANQGGAGGVLVVLDKTDGSIIEVVGNFAGVDDIESLGFFNSGNLFGSTGDNGPDPTDNNKFFLIDKFTAMLDEQSPIDPTGTDVDFEACDCLSGSINTISGEVFLDLNKNATEDAEPGLDSIVISLYRDIDSDSMFTAGVDILLDTTWTDANGMYSFTIASIGDFLITVDQSTLPPGSDMTTDVLLPSGFYSTNQTNSDNNFGVCLCPDIEALVFALQPTCVDGVPQSDGYLQISQVIGGDKYHYSTGSTFNNAGGSNNYSNATSLTGATYPVQFSTGLSNPTGSQDYTIRVYNGSDDCFIDVVVTMNEQDCQMGCECVEFLYVNDPSFDITHKFELNPDGSVGNEIYSSGTDPWLPEDVITNAHGVVGDVNGNLFISQIDTDPTALYKVSCDGTVISTDYFPGWNRTLNLATIGSTLYSIGREPTGGDYMIWSHDVCNNVALDSIAIPAAPSGNTSSWDISVGEDGKLYFSQNFAASGDDHCVYTVDEDLTTITQVFCLPNIAGHRILGIDQDGCGNFYTVINSNSSTIIYKVAPNGTVIDSIADTTLDGSGFAGGWGIIYNEIYDKLYIGTLGDDCVAVVDAGGCSGDLTYENALGVPHTPGAYSKAVDIVKQCCPTNNNVVIDTTVCNVNVPLFLRDIIGCDQAICEASWSEDPANIGMYFDECTELVTTDPEGCGTFTLESDGTAPNSVCGAFKITLNIDVIIAQIVSVRPDTSFCKGGSAELYATINNLDNLTYQWQSSTTSCTDGFSNISGATDSLYIASPTDTSYYRLITSTDGNCSDGSCSDTSACIVLNVVPNPVLTVTDQTICAGESVDLMNIFNSSTSGTISYHAGNPPSSANLLAGTIVSPTTTRMYYGLVVTPEGCSDTTMVTITVNPVDTTDIAVTICQGDTYNFNGQNLATAGTYFEDLVQTNGCDSIIRLDLMVTSTPDLATTNDEICEGESVNLTTLVTDNNSTAGNPTFHSAYPTNAGNQLASSTVSPTTTTEYYVFKGGATCNDVDSMTITVNPIITTDIPQTICGNTTYIFNGQNLNTSGIYLDTLTASTTCDSIIRLTLTVNPVDTTDISASICQGETYTFNGQNLATAGTYLDTLMQTNGCDSIIRLALTVTSTPDLATINDEICEGESVNLTTLVTDNNSTSGSPTFHSAFPTNAGNQLASSNVSPISTTEYYVFKGGATCNDFDSMTITVNPIVTTDIPQTICENDTYVFNGQSLNTSGVYLDTLTASTTCDSIIRLTLTVNPVDTTDIAASICQGETYTFNGQNLATAGMYLDTLAQTNGCDSIIRLALTVTSTPDLVSTNDTICLGETINLATLVSDNNSTAGSPTFHSAFPTNAGNQLSASTISPTSTTEFYVFKGGTSCSDVDSLTVAVHTPPVCSITGNNTVTPNTQDEPYTGAAGMTAYQWSVTSGDATIDGANNTQSINVDFGTVASTIQLIVSDANGCMDTCSISPTNGDFDLALQKDLAANQTDTISLGDDVNYTIKVYNEGNITATNIQVCDVIPTGMVLSPLDMNNWDDTNPDTVYQLIAGPLLPGDSVVVNITLRVVYGAAGSSLTNIAEITEAQDGAGTTVTDIDSTPANGDPGEDDIEEEVVQLLDHDPTGWIYCDKTGKIITGGNITVIGPNGIPNDEVNIVHNGINGYYEFYATGTAGVYTVTYSHPDGVTISTTKLPMTPALDPTGMASPVVLGVDTLAGGMYLSDTTFANNPYYLQFDFELGDPPVLLNNLPVRCAFIGSIVCLDDDTNGVDDGDEPPFPGTTVYLYDCADLTTPLDSTVTGADGKLAFDGLFPGDYMLQYDVPYGYQIISSQADTLTNGFTSCMTLDWGDCDTTKVACFGVIPSVFDVALKKEVLTPAPYQGGDDVTFEITVYNQGTITATNLVIQDYIPTGLALNDTNWNEVSPQVAEETIATLAGGDSTTLYITLRIHSSFSGNLVNNAEIVSADGGIDQDSPLATTNDGTTNELATDNNINDEAPNTPGTGDLPSDEDDYDPALIQVGCPLPKCEPHQIQVNQNSN